MFAIGVAGAPYPSFHPDLYLSGTPGRFAAIVVRAGRSNARESLWLDNLFVLSWLVIVPRLMRAGLQRWAPERRRLFGPWGRMPAVAIVAGTLDLVENGLSLFLVGKDHPSPVITLAIASIAWTKWILYVVSLAGIGALVLGPLVAPVVRPMMNRFGALLDALFDAHAGVHVAPTTAARPDDPAPAVSPMIGICLSGGGVQAASVAIGALRRFDAVGADGPSLLHRSRWLVVVSGGALAARGSFVRLNRVASTLARTCVVFGAVLAATYIVGCAAGTLTQTRALYPEFPYVAASGDELLGWRTLMPLRLVLPGVVLMLTGGVLAFAASSMPDSLRQRQLRLVSSMSMRAGALVGVALVGVPFGVVYGRRVMSAFPNLSTNGAAALLGGLCVLGVVGALIGIFIAQRKVPWMRAGGVLLAVFVIGCAGKAADAFAFGAQGLWRSWPVPFSSLRVSVFGVAVIWLLFADFVPSNRLALGGVNGREPLWDPCVGGPGPELIVVATAYSSIDTFGGLPAFGFTFQSSRITLHDRNDDTSASVATSDYPTGSWWQGYPRRWTVTGSTALSGAAMVSPMGRQALGATNALLVAVNLRLGAWVPNPRFPTWFADPATAPRVHLGYLANALFGRYRPDRDPFVYVADGGHRDNLGLVELLRERPDVVYCLDASGDRRGTFQTLHEAIELSRMELDIDVVIDLSALEPTNTMPPDCAALGTIGYPDGSSGTFVYGTIGQYPDDADHLQLVALGHHVADRMVAVSP
jgi:hypothetical protein